MCIISTIFIARIKLIINCVCPMMELRCVVLKISTEKKVKLENSASQPVNKQPSSVMSSMSCYKLYFMCNGHRTGTYLNPVLKASCRFDLSTTTIRRPFWGVGEGGGRESLQQRIFDLFIYSLMFSLVGGKIKV